MTSNSIVYFSSEKFNKLDILFDAEKRNVIFDSNGLARDLLNVQVPTVTLKFVFFSLGGMVLSEKKS